MGDLFSFGYAGLRGADDLRHLLAGTGVETIVDVRLQPFGRVPFNGPAASRLLIESVGPAYRWDKRLGNLAYRTGGIEIKDIEAIEDVLDDLRAGRSVALMCVCANVAECHRRVLAEEAVRREPGLRVIHLAVRRVAFLAPDASDDQIEAFVDALTDCS